MTIFFYKNEVTITIKGELPDLNKFIFANRSNKYVGASVKKDANYLVAYTAISQLGKGFKTIREPVFIEYHWYCKNKRKDKSNIAFAKKFVEDGLQDAGILAQDNWNAIIGFSDHFYVDPKDPRVVAIIKYQ